MVNAKNWILQICSQQIRNVWTFSRNNLKAFQKYKTINYLQDLKIDIDRRFPEGEIRDLFC